MKHHRGPGRPRRKPAPARLFVIINAKGQLAACRPKGRKVKGKQKCIPVVFRRLKDAKDAKAARKKLGKKGDVIQSYAIHSGRWAIEPVSAKQAAAGGSGDALP